MRKYLSKLSVREHVPQDVSGTLVDGEDPFLAHVPGLGCPSSFPALWTEPAHLCSLQKQTAQSHFAVTVPVRHSVFRRLIVSSRKKCKHPFRIGVLLAFENQPTFFLLLREIVYLMNDCGKSGKWCCTASLGALLGGQSAGHGILSSGEGCERRGEPPVWSCAHSPARHPPRYPPQYSGALGASSLPASSTFCSGAGYADRKYN